MKKYVFLFLSLIAATASGQPAKGSNAGYSVLCIEEQSVGFNWENKQWVPKNFKGKTLMVSRIAADKYINAKDKPVDIVSCVDKRADDRNLGVVTLVNACYTMVPVGKMPNFLDAQMCTEFWEGNKLSRVTCENHSSKFSFEPAGGFIKHPWHMDVHLTDAKKDSLTVGVGQCSPIN